ncbi:hypothetical protein [Candidatus Poriferisocius sp.]|uniref:hypothetical protein n=1 Tax=Candidatus Poriferisocius sp. TaxID=3101276 RepID=UPI003B5CF54D
MRTTTLPRPPVILEQALEDPDVLLGILERQSPHPMTLAGAEFAESRAYLRAGARTGDVPPFVQVVDGEPRIPPVFRTTWGAEEQAVPGADVIVNNPRFIDAARRLYDAEVVRPYFTYVNINAPAGQYERHTDIPAFRGIGRDRYPTWLLNCMLHSGCFDRWRLKIATAVCWYYEGTGGEFTYWPEGWDGEQVVIDPPYNYGVMGDNDYMPHRVERIGGPGDHPKYGFDATIRLTSLSSSNSLSSGKSLNGLSSLSSLTPERQWVIEEPGHSPVVHAFDEVRVSLSWKAFVFTDDHEAEVFDQRLDDLDEATLVATLAEDCARRGVSVPEGPDALSDPEFGDKVRDVYLSSDLRF